MVGCGTLSQPSVGLNPLSINTLSLCLWVKFPIDKDLTCCVSGTYPPHFSRPEKLTWNLPTLHLFPQSPRKAPAEFRFHPSLRNFVPPGAAHEAAAGHTLSEPSRNSASRATTVARRAVRQVPHSHSRNRRAAYCG